MTLQALMKRLHRRRLIFKVLLKNIIQKRRFVKRTRTIYSKSDYKNSSFARILLYPDLDDPNSKNGKDFRRNFRVPYSIFLDIVAWAKNNNIRQVAAEDYFHHSSVPIELLILSTLTILGRGVIFPIASMLTGVSEPVIRKFYHLFCKTYSNQFYKIECELPKDINDVNSILQSYGRLGLPGCIGSTDCVHVAWDRCPAANRNLHKGKEGYPTLVYSVTCTHSRRIIGCTTSFAGTMNDKTISN